METGTTGQEHQWLSYDHLSFGSTWGRQQKERNSWRSGECTFYQWLFSLDSLRAKGLRRAWRTWNIWITLWLLWYLNEDEEPGFQKILTQYLREIENQTRKKPGKISVGNLWVLKTMIIKRENPTDDRKWDGNKLEFRESKNREVWIRENLTKYLSELAD